MDCHPPRARRVTRNQMEEESVSAQEIVEVVGELVPDEGAALERRRGPQALAVAREIETALVPHLEGNPAYAPLWQQFQAAPQAMAPALAGVLQVLLAADAALARRLDTLLDRYRQAATPASTAINTGGGAYVGGHVTVTGGDFVGRDKREIRITGDGNVVGDSSSATVVKPAADPEAVARVFRQFHAAVEAHPDLPPQDRADLQADLAELEEEVARGEQADEGFLARRLRNIGRMAPDILEVVLATFARPSAGLGVVARKVAQRMRIEAEGQDEPGAREG